MRSAWHLPASRSARGTGLFSRLKDPGRSGAECQRVQRARSFLAYARTIAEDRARVHSERLQIATRSAPCQQDQFDPSFVPPAGVVAHLCRHDLHLCAHNSRSRGLLFSPERLGLSDNRGQLSLSRFTGAPLRNLSLFYPQCHRRHERARSVNSPSRCRRGGGRGIFPPPRTLHIPGIDADGVRDLQEVDKKGTVKTSPLPCRDPGRQRPTTSCQRHG